MARLTFFGAAETVTGSKYLLETDAARVLVDCGLFQGLKQLRQKNWERLPFDPAGLPAVVLTHAHIDHIGYLPRLVKDGFRGPVFCTPATAELAPVMLYDAAKNQEEDAEYANRKGFSKHAPALPLFDEGDVTRTLKLLRPIERDEWFAPIEPIWMRYHDAGHLLGSAMIEVELRGPARPTRLLFSGDVGRYDAPLYHDPQPPPPCDVLVCESTYGDREHPAENVLDQLCGLVERSIRRGGVMLIAAFAVGRAQQLVYLLRTLIARKRIPELPIYVDSPMAVDATRIYCDYSADHDLSESELTGPDCVFFGPNIHLVRSAQESKAINKVGGPAVIISSSGMMAGGRILHHLRQRLPHERNTIVLGGYMAEGTRGRLLAQGAARLRIHGFDVPVHAAVEAMSALSGHAGHSELRRWLAPLPPPRQVFITHGELATARSLAQELHKDLRWNAVVPRLGQTFELLESAPAGPTA